MNHKDNLLKKIEVKESQLHSLEQERSAWNSEKLKDATNDSLSNVLEESLRKDIARLKEKLASI